MAEEKESGQTFARCAACHQPTKQKVTRLLDPTDDTIGYVVPVYHKDCVPESRQSGPNGRRKVT